MVQVVFLVSGASHNSALFKNQNKMIAVIPLIFANIKCGSSFSLGHTITRSVSSQMTLLQSSINADSITSQMNFDFSVKSIESEFTSALEKAREMDKRYGLCTEPSQQAWSAVDSLYAKLQTFQRPTTDTEVSGSSPSQKDTKEIKKLEDRTTSTNSVLAYSNILVNYFGKQEV